MVVLIDVESGRTDMCEAMAALRRNSSTSHLPVIAFAGENSPELQATAQSAGATLLVTEAAILTHLPQFLEQALQVD